MMFYEFDELSRNKQRRVLLEHGVYLDSRMTDDLILTLYAVDDFYVELYTCRINKELIDIRSFEHSDKLEPYLERIEIPQTL